MILSAMYYPHTGIQTADLMKQALLLWDQVEYLAPEDEFVPTYSSTPKLGRQAYNAVDAELMREAMKLIGKPYVPSESEQDAAHETIMELVRAGIPSRILASDEAYQPDYAIYGGKFLYKTWQELRKANLAVYERHGNFDDFAVHTKFGLLMMAILTDCCIGTQSCKLTDRSSVYRALGDALQGLNVFSEVDRKGPKTKRPAMPLRHAREEEDELAAQDYVVTISLRVFDLSDVSLKSLVALRRRENEKGGYRLTKLRHSYLAKVNEYAQEIATVQTKKDLKELDRKLKQSLELSREELEDELEYEGITFAKESLRASVKGSLALAKLFTDPINAAIDVFQIKPNFKKYQHDRNKTLSEHPLGYLYAAKKLPMY
jgi:hypothetical protein